MRFLFVDSIDEFEPGRRARGLFLMPRDFALPACLIAEAIGQLASWIAMEHAQFNMRPVAGLVGQCVIEREARPDELVELAVEMEECETDAVSYAGRARADDSAIVMLERCGAPMLPLQDFDDRGATRSRFAALCSPAGGRVGADRKLAMPLPLSEITYDSNSATATLTTPAEADFYADHFPRRPVFPATLLLDAEIRLARTLTEHLGLSDSVTRPLIRVSDVKLRTFIAPGQALELAALMRGHESASVDFTLSAKIAGKRVATAELRLERN
jgi:3-hydroxymyristoyl/3-hydroxydecanoyl-(acyl carrier protein) dehydratase